MPSGPGILTGTPNCTLGAHPQHVAKRWSVQEVAAAAFSVKALRVKSKSMSYKVSKEL
jgi:hypothetical protein